MSSDPTPAEDPAGDTEQGSAFDAVEQVLRAGYFDGMLRRLQASFPSLPQPAVEDALYEAAERCAKRPEPPDNVRAWLYAAARNRLRDVTRRRPTESFDPDDSTHDTRRAPSAEDESFPDDTYRAVVKHVEGWPVSKRRVVVLLVLEAAHEHEPLPNDQLARLAGELLGEPMSPETAAVHKSRGMARLRAEYPTIFPEA